MDWRQKHYSFAKVMELLVVDDSDMKYLDTVGSIRYRNEQKVKIQGRKITKY